MLQDIVSLTVLNLQTPTLSLLREGKKKKELGKTPSFLSLFDALLTFFLFALSKHTHLH